MAQLMNSYYTAGVDLHPIERSAMSHAIYVGIHSFTDGNERTSRLLLNLEMMKEGRVSTSNYKA